VVIWLFAGGGESEIRGLAPFLTKHFACRFERQTPVRQKPGPKPPQNGTPRGYGHTGKSLAAQIKTQLPIALNQDSSCDLILVIDDLDCHDSQQREDDFLKAIDSIPAATDIERFVGFAAPELEAWLIADWDHTLARDVDFRQNHTGMRHWLSQEKKVPFAAPETFSVYDQNKDACHEKLSEAIIEASLEKTHNRYSKALHTPRLLQNLDPEVVSKKCPLFKEMYVYLSGFCRNPS